MLPITLEFINRKSNMSVIVTGHEKGGTGKSVLATSFAAKVIQSGATAVVVDTDATATSAGWNAIRDSRNILPVVPVVQQLVNPAPAIIELATKYDAVVVDVGARDYAKLRDLARICDLWIAPTTVGQGDLTSTVRLFEAISEFHALHKNGKIPFVVVFNRVSSTWNSNEEVDAREFLEQMCEGIVILKSHIKERKAWRDAGRLGLGVSEMPSRDAAKSIEEFESVYDEALLQHSKS